MIRTSSPTMSAQPVAPKSLRLTLPVRRTVRRLKSSAALPGRRDIVARKVTVLVTPADRQVARHIGPFARTGDAGSVKVYPGMILGIQHLWPLEGLCCKRKACRGPAHIQRDQDRACPDGVEFQAKAGVFPGIVPVISSGPKSVLKVTGEAAGSKRYSMVAAGAAVASDKAAIRCKRADRGKADLRLVVSLTAPGHSASQGAVPDP